MRNFSKLFVAAVLSFNALSAWSAPNLVLNPSRLVLEKNQRSAQIDLTNTGDQVGTYRIKIENKRMDENGKMQNVGTDKRPGEHFAAEMVQYSPRQVELSPGSSQTIRLSLRKPANLEAGEYRSHIVFERIPDAYTTSIENINKPKSGEIGITLTALVGISIPMIVRHGDTSAQTSLSEVKFQPGTSGEAPSILAKIERSGNQSVYGDVVVKMLDANGKEKEVAVAAGVAVYTPNSSRKVKLVVRPEDSKMDFSNKTFRIIYKEQESSGGKEIAQTTLQTPSL